MSIIHIYKMISESSESYRKKCISNFNLCKGGVIGDMMQTGMDMWNMLAGVPYAMMCQGLASLLKSCKDTCE